MVDIELQSNNNEHIHMTDNILNIKNNINNINYPFDENDINAIINYPNTNHNQAYFIHLINNIINHIKNNNIFDIQLHNISNINVLCFINNAAINQNQNHNNENIVDDEEDIVDYNNEDIVDYNNEEDIVDYNNEEDIIDYDIDHNYPIPSNFEIDEIQQIPLNIVHITHDEDCTVCLGTINMGSECTKTSCGHYFHSECIQPWIMSNNSCPNCRHNLY